MTHDLASRSVRAAKRMSDIPRSGIRGALERVRVGEFVNLAGGDPSFPTPEHICAAAYEASLHGDTHYTHGRGALALREAFAAKLERENGLREVDPETEILVAAGALNALVPQLAVELTKQTIKKSYEMMGFRNALDWHRMADTFLLAASTPEKEELRRRFEQGGLRAFLAARDGQFRDE
jgi:DNA-binding transcriptional MocR family regulator